MGLWQGEFISGGNTSIFSTEVDGLIKPRGTLKQDFIVVQLNHLALAL